MIKNAADIAIRIGADFVGLPAFKKADTAVDKLYKSTKKLAGAFGIAFSAQGIARFGAASVRAFAAEEKQIAALTTTVKNLGLAFTAPQVNEYIENLERLTGIAREELQPAFQKLLTQTGSITKSQKILSAAVEVSFSGLMSVAEAADVLTKAYVGNTKGLRSLNLGLTTAELNMMSFDEILNKVSATYKSQFNAAQDTTQVKLDKFNVAVGNAIENIGGGLVDAFSKFAGNGDLDRANAGLEKFSENLADVIANSNLVQLAMGYLNPATLIPSLIRGNKDKGTKATGLGGSYYTYKAQQDKLAKAEQTALIRAKKLEADKLAILKKQTTEKKLAGAIDKANALLNTAKDLFDLERIGVTAAMANQTLTDNERKRLEIKQATFALEDALDSKDANRIEKATLLLSGLMNQFAVLQKQDVLLGQIKTALDALGINKDLINLMNLEDAYAWLKKLKELMDQLGSDLSKKKKEDTSNNGGNDNNNNNNKNNNQDNPFITAITNATSRSEMNAAVNAAAQAGVDAGAVANALTMSLLNAGVKTNNALSAGRYTGQALEWWNQQVAEINRLNAMAAAIAPGHLGVTIQVTENAKNLVDIIMDTVTEQSASGNPPVVTRIDQNLAW